MNDETMNVRMELAFPERRREDLERLNALLGSVNWSSVQYSDFEGYHAECKEYAADSGEVCSVTHWYGLDRITLECRQEEGKPGYRYRMSTEYLPPEREIAPGSYYSLWANAHPGCVLRMMSHVEFENGGNAFVVLFREGPGDGAQVKEFIRNAENGEEVQ